MTARPFVALLLVLLAACSSGGGPAPAKPAGAQAERTIADFSLPDLQGQPVRLSDSSGKVRLVDFWATWCAPCREEIPMFKELHATYGPRGLTLLAVSDEDAKTVQAFVQKEEIPWQNLLDADGKVAEQFGGVLGLPTAFLLDGEGKVVAQFNGLVPRHVLEPKIKELLDRTGGGA